MQAITNLNRESLIYLTVYIYSVIYGLYSLISIRDDILKISKLQFAEGWSFVGRPRDDTNDELENFTDYMATAWPCYLLHALIMHCVHKYCPSKQNIAHAIVCLCICCYLLTVQSVLSLLVLSSTFFILTRCNIDSKLMVWALAAVWMLFINVVKEQEYWHRTLGYRQYYYLIIMISWSVLRCCSYALTNIIDKRRAREDPDKVKDSTAQSWQSFAGYVFYFPCLIFGPFISYNRYRSGELNANKRTSWPRFLLELARTGFWYFFLYFAMHFLYIHYMSRDVSTFKLVDTVLARSAAGYLIGELFFMYYIVTYGLGIAFARFDGLNPPRRPRCIGSIHYYSEMWKYFDEGLYEFLFKHIYAELCKPRSPAWMKILASGLTFAFVFVWHGCYYYIMLWSFLNFCCLVLEKFLRIFVKSATFKYWVGDRLGLSELACKRVEAMLGTQLFILAVFSNVYFIGGYEMGKLLMYYTYGSGIQNYLKLVFFCFCFFQSCEVMQQWRCT